MTRRMSCAMTIDAVRNRTKTVTRRHENTWKNLRPGDRLTLVEKAMGLPKGATQVILAEVEILDVRVEPITRLTFDELAAEGFAGTDWTPMTWGLWWARSHGYTHVDEMTIGLVDCRRIEWRYLDDGDPR